MGAPTAKTGRSIRALPEQWARWEALAHARGQDVSEWVRDACDAAARAEAGGVAFPEDADFVAAVEELRVHYPVRHPSEIVRMAVLTALERQRRTRQAFAREPDPPQVVPFTPGGSGPPPRPKGGR